MRACLLVLCVGLLSSCQKRVSNTEALIAPLRESANETNDIVKMRLADSVRTLIDGGITRYVHRRELTQNGLGATANFSKSMASNVYVTKDTSLDDSFFNFLRKTDPLEDKWIDFAKSKSELVSWQYAYHLSSNTIRIYPWIDLSSLVGPKMTWTMVSFFSSMDTVKNYQKHVFCTRPYDDIGGTGINVSCCKVFNPTGAYSDVALTCMDVSFKAQFEKTRKAFVAAGNSDYTFLLIQSSAPEIAYKKFAKYDFVGNSVEYLDDINAKELDLHQVGVFDALNFKLFLGKEMGVKSGG